MTGAAARDTRVGLAVALTTLLWTALVATEGAGRWPWAGAVLLAEAAFLLLLVPGVSRRLRAWVTERPSRGLGALAGLAACGMALHAVTGIGLGAVHGAARFGNVILWPVCIGAAALALGKDDGTEASPGRLLLMSLGIWALAGVWDDRLQVRPPGDLDIGLPYFAALAVAIWLLVVVRPLRGFDVGLGLRPRDIGTALLAVLALFVVALPVGTMVGFLRPNLRWNGAAYQAARLFGLTLFVGLPEELLFRGIWQEALSRLWGGRAGWIAASVLFGLTHIVKHAPPLNWRYALLASIAGLAYGWVYQRTRRLAAAAVTHGLVDWIWSSFLLVP